MMCVSSLKNQVTFFLSTPKCLVDYSVFLYFDHINFISLKAFIARLKPVLKVETRKMPILVNLGLADIVCVSAVLGLYTLSQMFTRKHSFMSKRPSSSATSHHYHNGMKV